MTYLCKNKFNTMNKKIFLIVAIVCFGFSSFYCSNVFSQAIQGSGINAFIKNQKHKNGLQNAFAQRYCLYNIDNKEYVSLIAKLKENCNLKFLKKYDYQLGSRLGQIITLRVNIQQVEQLVKEKDILYIETSRKIDGKLLKNAPYDLEANKVYEGIDLLQPYTGKGVIIGIADWGSDYTHPTFYDSLLEDYRILAAWDQFRKQGPAPEGFSYGTLIEGKEALLQAGTDTCNIYDTGSHATHVGGICAGSGAGTQYRGIAFEANILYCNWLVDEASYMDGCVWMRDYAKALGKRLVINNSWGVYSFGCMDGSSLLDQFINTMSEQDSVVFVVSAGNNGDCNFHLKADFNSSHEDTLRTITNFNFPTPYSEHYWGETITLQSEDRANFSTMFEFYDYQWEKIGQTPVLRSDGSVVEEDFIVTPSGDSIVYRASSRANSQNKPLVDWEIRQSKYRNNTNRVVLCIIADTGVVHAWNLACLTTGVGNWGLDFTSGNREGYLQGDTQYGISEPALAQQAITVGAHRYRKSGDWTPILTSFSSKGPVMAPYQKPDITAPGYCVWSAYSSYASEKSPSKVTIDFNDKTYQFAEMSGTSMSGPMVTGTVALILQANNKLLPQEIKQLITQTAKMDEYTGQCPNNSWGYGKVNAYQAVKQAEQYISLPQIDIQPLVVYPMPTKDYLYIQHVMNDSFFEVFDLTGRKVLGGKLNRDYIYVKDLKSGVYLLNINDKEQKHRIKFIKE